MSSNLALMPFSQPGLALLEGWLARPHVARWYPEPEDNLAWAAAPPDGGAHVLITTAGTPVGYMRWQVVDRETLDSVGLTEVPSNAVDIDLLLGETDYVGKGLGPAALDALVNQLRANPELPVAGLTSSVDNTQRPRGVREGWLSCHPAVLAARLRSVPLVPSLVEVMSARANQ